jgi:hypothetical protein
MPPPGHTVIQGTRSGSVSQQRHLLQRRRLKRHAAASQQATAEAAKKTMGACSQRLPHLASCAQHTNHAQGREAAPLAAAPLRSALCPCWGNEIGEIKAMCWRAMKSLLPEMQAMACCHGFAQQRHRLCRDALRAWHEHPACLVGATKHNSVGWQTLLAYSHAPSTRTHAHTRAHAHTHAYAHAHAHAHTHTPPLLRASSQPHTHARTHTRHTHTHHPFSGRQANPTLAHALAATATLAQCTRGAAKHNARSLAALCATRAVLNAAPVMRG